MAVVGQNGAGKTTLAKLLCRLYDPDSGRIRVDGDDLRDLDLAGWRRNVTAVFQDFVRFELSLRANVDPSGQADDDQIRAALVAAGADRLAELDTPLAKGYAGGTDLSGGQWQRVALARALCAVARGAGLVLLDEPTAQLDVRGEAEVFERVLAATRGVTTILVSHRFSTVRQVDRICVLEARSGGRAGQPRRADGPGRPLSDDVRPAGPAVRAPNGTKKGWPSMSSDSDDPDRRRRTCRRRCASMIRLFRLGFVHEPRLLLASVAHDPAPGRAGRLVRALAEIAGRRDHRAAPDCARTGCWPRWRSRRR